MKSLLARFGLMKISVHNREITLLEKECAAARNWALAADKCVTSYVNSTTAAQKVIEAQKKIIQHDEVLMRGYKEAIADLQRQLDAAKKREEEAAWGMK